MLWSKTKTTSSSQVLPDVQLDSERLYLRPARIEDWSQWAKVRQANREHLQPFEPTWGENCLEAGFFERRLKRQAREWQLDHAQGLLILKKDETLIGGMNINNICRGAAQFCSLGYWIAKNVEGQGYMAEALKRTIQYCFEDLKLHRINCSTLLHNERSKKLLLNAGFEKEGLAKHYLKINGEWQDHILYGLSKESWIR